MRAATWCSQGPTSERGTRADGLFRCRLTSRRDVKRTPCACRNQNRPLMRGGRA
jgi:hypothetical protein